MTLDTSIVQSGISGCGKYELFAATLFYMPVSKPPVMASSTQCIHIWIKFGRWNTFDVRVATAFRKRIDVMAISWSLFSKT